MQLENLVQLRELAFLNRASMGTAAAREAWARAPSYATPDDAAKHICWRSARLPTNGPRLPAKRPRSTAHKTASGAPGCVKGIQS